MGDAYADIPRHGGDFARAVAVCINSRRCEADGRQVMCPSYRVSGNPHLSTGGRVRLLKAALSSDLVDEALADPTLAEAMALCVACKGCRRECEAKVDMATIKSEYLAQRYAREGPGLRDILFAFTPWWLTYVRGLRLAIAWRNRSRRLADLAQRWLGLSAARPLPSPAPRPFADDAAAVDSPAAPLPDRPEVVLLVDTFSRHFEPAVAQAALTVLRAGGYRVSVAEPMPAAGGGRRPLCCGRTYLAQGMVDRARSEAARTLAVLRRHLDAGRAVVGLEASCVLGLREDAQALGLDEGLLAAGRQLLLFEEFLARESTVGRLALPLRPLPDGETLVHGHCHQKAVGATKAMRKVLRLIPGHRFEAIEAGCCGMAGTFGLEAEHASMSSQMAELALLPALRERPAARVVANGFSCRAQIRAHGDPRPHHLAQLLCEALDEGMH